MTTIYDEFIQTLIPGKILAVQVGLSRTAVMAETDEGLRCGLSGTLSNPEFDHRLRPSVRNAGHLHEMSFTDLAGLVESDSYTEVSIGLAAINALLPHKPDQWTEQNGEDYIAQASAGKNVAVVGHFPFVDWLKESAANLWVLELEPREGDLPASAAPEIIPQADLVAITGTTLINNTFQDLVELCRPDARVVLIGPSSPLSPVLFDHGVDIISGTVVTDPQRAMLGISQGSALSQLRREGCIRLVTMKKEGK
ncbi:MAG: DUF364 domain-containing protein [Anaerolineaceae bacterium]